MGDKGNVSENPFKMAVACSFVAILLVILALATPEWTVTDDLTIGLWKITKGGVTYTWTDTGEYNAEFFYSTWFQSVRGLIIAGLLVGIMGSGLNLYVIFKKRYSYGNILLAYYLLAFALVVISAALYVIQVVQGVDQNGNITSDENEIVSYTYLTDYGYSMWFAWIGAGIFLPAAGMAYEGSNQKVKYDKLQEYITANV